MNGIMDEILEFMKENDVKFIRLAFCDLLGFQKNISIMPEEFSSAFEHGISFDAHAIRCFRNIQVSDLLLFPDPATLTVLPWRPGPGRVVRFYCDIRHSDGTPFLYDGRYLLKQTVERAEKMGYNCKIGSECEFYLFKTGEDGEPGNETLDKGGYLDIPPLDKGENIRREICLTLEEMGMKPERSHHEQGPGQNEIDFKFDDALTSADHLLTFKSVVKAIAMRNGLFASFMPKPIWKEAGSGLHVNLSLSQNGYNIFRNRSEGHSKIAESFIAGILSKVPEITTFLNPLVNSYKRFGEFEAPKYVSWSHQNRSQLVRIPAAVGEKVRMELRSPDPSLNPYLAFSLIIAAGLDGIDHALELPPAFDEDLSDAKTNLGKELAALPESLEEAIRLTEESSFVERVIGKELLSAYLSIKKEEMEAFLASDHEETFYRERYFDFI